MTKLIQKEIMKFDNDLGDAVRNICPRPEELTEQQARRLIAEHQEVLERAFHGTTMALALINVDQRFMWAAGVGDSTVGEQVWRDFYRWRALTFRRAFLHGQGWSSEGTTAM